MKRVLYFCIIIFFIFLLYLAYFTSKEGYMDFDEDDKQVLGITGITQICTPDMYNYGDPTVCFDVSYIDAANSKTVRVKAEIEPGYFINKSGFLQIVPYGYVATTDKLSYVTKTKTAAYEQASFANTNAAIDISINNIQNLINATSPTDTVKIQGYKQEIENLQQQKLSIMEDNTTSNKMYNSDNLDITYHADPTQEIPSDENDLIVGRMWIKDKNGNLKSVPYDEVKNTTHYYPAGSYVFNPPTYVPDYEESVFLSKLTNLPTLMGINTPCTDDFCADTADSTIDRETRCNALDHTSCGKSNCCVLFGGEKCVAGDSRGPSILSNYSDITIINRDYYYYKGTCYGNCT